MVTIVLLPGMDGTGQLFEPFIAALEREFSVKIVHYPTTEPLGYSELESVARAALPAEGPYVILGESFSGPIAVSLAVSDSQQLKGLILCCSFVRNPRPLLSGLRSLVGVLPVAWTPIGLLSYLLLGRFSTAALRSALAHVIEQVSATALRARLKSVLSIDVSATLTAVKVPTFYLRASRDRIVPVGASELVTRLNPNARIVQLEAPHFLLQAVPSAAARIVGTFVREVQ